MSNKEKFLKLVSDKKTDTLERSKKRIKNRKRLRESQDIALKVLTKLQELGWTQRKLAKEMGVSPQQVNKIVRGKENLTLETQVALQSILDIPILASYYDKKKRESKLETQKSIVISLENMSVQIKPETHSSEKKWFKMGYSEGNTGGTTKYLA